VQLYIRYFASDKTSNGNTVNCCAILYIDLKETFMLKKGISYDTLTDFAVFAKEISLKLNRGVKLNIGCL